MHHRIHTPIEQSVLGFEAHDPERTRFVVLPAAAIRFRVATHIRVLGGGPPFATPLGARNTQQIG